MLQVGQIDMIALFQVNYMASCFSFTEINYERCKDNNVKQMLFKVSHSCKMKC